MYRPDGALWHPLFCFFTIVSQLRCFDKPSIQFFLEKNTIAFILLTFVKPHLPIKLAS